MIEQTLILGADSHLVATATLPIQRGNVRPPCVAILTNSGVIPRIGPHRMNVHLARSFAELGIPSVRFDLSGLGDSQRSSSNLPIRQQWVADTRAVMDMAQVRFGCDRFFMIGFCSGAGVAYSVALEDPRMRAALLWDMYAYPTIQSRLRTMLFRLRRVGLRNAFEKLLSKSMDTLRTIVQPATRVARETTEPTQIPPIGDFARGVQTLVDRDVELLFAYSGGEPERFNHIGQFRSMFGRYGFFDRVEFGYLEVSDHLITRQVAQRAFLDMTEKWLRERLLVEPAIAPH